jgi:hypothetical protein
MAILILLNYRDTYKLHAKDPDPTLFTEQNLFLKQKKGEPIITIEKITDLVDEVKTNK